MSFQQLIIKVEQAEQALEAQERRTSAQWTRLKSDWREAWTPARIVIVGAVSGFLVGRSRPLRVAHGGDVLQMVSALAGLFAGGSAQAAAGEAAQAAQHAEGAATAAADAVPAPVITEPSA